MERRIIHVETGRSYEIEVGKGLLDKAGELIHTISKTEKIAVITDSNVNELYTDRLIKSLTNKGFDCNVFVFEAGEKSKTHDTLFSIYKFLADNQYNRSDLVVALGGGVVGDVAGFAAATFMRGMDFVQIPTTLLAEVDSSIGGKTAIDLPQGKNLVGAFFQPRLVICDPTTLETLPDRVFSDGMAEAIKHTCIKDKNLFSELLMSDKISVDFICKNIQIKRKVVQNDELEHGERMMLNFGHTLGHAIEKIYGFDTYTHGEAVAIGMVMITKISEKKGLTEIGTADKIIEMLKKFNLPTECSATMKEIVEASKTDKKHSDGGITVVLLKSIGQAFLYRISDEKLEEFFLED